MRINSLFRIEIPKVVDVSLMLRALAVIAVIYWHVHGYRAEGYVERIFTVSGKFAVWVFFVLSGYLIGLSLISRYEFSRWGLLSFYRNRFLRILPIFYFVSFTLMAFKYFFGKPPMDFSLFNPIRELLMLQGEHSYSLNGVFWTLGVECQFYLVAPFFILLFRQDQVAKVYIRIGFVLILLLISKNLWDYQDLRRIDARGLFGNSVHFLVGILVAFLYPLISSRASFLN